MIYVQFIWEKKHLDIGGLGVRMTSGNLFQILEIPKGMKEINEKVNLNMRETDYKRNCLKRDDILEKLKDTLNKNNKENTNDVVKLWILLLLATLLVPQIRYFLDLHYIGYVDDLGSLHEYS